MLLTDIIEIRELTNMIRPKGYYKTSSVTRSNVLWFKQSFVTDVIDYYNSNIVIKILYHLMYTFITSYKFRGNVESQPIPSR